MIKILVIDDDEYCRHVIKFSLIAHGFDVVEAIDGREGARQARGFPALDGLQDGWRRPEPLRGVSRGRVRGQLRRAGEAGGQRKTGIETRRARQQPFGVLEAGVGS